VPLKKNGKERTMKTMAQRVAGMPPTIFATMTELAQRHAAINLGQGFPDHDPPPFIRAAAHAALDGPFNQYAPGNGHLPLRQAISARMQQCYGLNYQADGEILVTVGATEALFAAMMGLLDPGDEVILFDPCFDSYRPAIDFAGAHARSYVLRPPQWQIDAHQLESLITSRTRLVLLNSPQNPIGKVFTRRELEIIAALCIKYDLIAVCDEVYEHIVFDGQPHIPLASLPGMRERSLCISSLAKTFSVTGWKLGWACGPNPLLDALLRAKQFVTYCAAAPLQIAGAVALQTPANFYQQLAQDYQQKRDFLFDQFARIGWQVLPCQGTYYLMVDIREARQGTDVEFCHWLVEKIGVAAIPASPFYANPLDGAQLVRFAFCKSPAVLEEAVKRLKTRL